MRFPRLEDKYNGLDEEPPNWQDVFLTVFLGLVAAVLLLKLAFALAMF